MNHGDKALVNGEPCVRVGLRLAFDTPELDIPCSHCPRYASKEDGCDLSCGGTFVWVRKHVWVSILLEAP